MQKQKELTEIEYDKKFNKNYERLKETVEHIEYAISGSEIDSDLENARKCITKLEKLRETEIIY